MSNATSQRVWKEMRPAVQMGHGRVLRLFDATPLLSLGSSPLWTLALQLLSSVTLGLPHSEPQFPHLESVNNEHLPHWIIAW